MGEEKVTMEKINKYVELDQKIQLLEFKNIRKNMKMKQNHLKDVEVTQGVLKDKYEECQAKSKKEKGDLSEEVAEKIQKLLGSKKDSKMTPDEAEYLEAINEEQSVKIQLDGITKQIGDIKKDIKSKQPEVDELDKLTEEQDKLLSDIFGGSYGSPRENELENKLDMLVEKTGRIKVAKSKWQNGKALLEYAVNQLAIGVAAWKQLPTGQSESDLKALYSKATEARNNLLAAHSNIINTQNYLKNITFPYCKKEEMETLMKAIKNIYVDSGTKERREHALQCYSTTHKRAYALLQWFDNVIKSVIDKDYKEAVQEERECSQQLRNERLKLMKEIAEKQGGTCNIDQIQQQQFKDDDFEEELAGITDADDVPGVTGTSRDMPPPTPMPLKNLAAAPDKEMLFSNIDQLKNEYSQNMMDFKKTQEVNKTRIEQGLEEKLEARRNRRKRMGTS